MNVAARVLNSALILGSAWAGYSSMSPENLRHMNLDLTFCLLALAAAPFAVFASISYSINGAKQEMLRRPNFNRFTLNWWHDPLQCLYLTTLSVAAGTVGCAMRLFGTSSTGVWTFLSSFCFAVGLLVGQYFAYRVYHARLQAGEG